MKKFISFSGGVESRTMALIYGGSADALFADTGSEHQALYDQLDDVERKIREFHKNDFKIIKVKNSKYDSLEDYIRFSKFFPSFRSRFCTRMFKIEPIDDYLRQFEDEGVELMIGLNADEKDKRTGNYGLLPFVKYKHPLADNGLTREACIKILKKADLFPDFPPYMQRGGCKFCYYKSKKEYKAMAILNESEFDDIIKLEEGIQDERKDYYHIIPGIENLRDFKSNSKAILFNKEDLYRKSELRTPCGVFCNR